MQFCVFSCARCFQLYRFLKYTFSYNSGISNSFFKNDIKMRASKGNPLLQPSFSIEYIHCQCNLRYWLQIANISNIHVTISDINISLKIFSFKGLCFRYVYIGSIHNVLKNISCKYWYNVGC